MYRSIVLAGLVSSLLLTLASTAVACLWDYDTLLAERRQFPGALELITGKFLRHSPELYRWRVEDRRRRLAADPDDVAAYDDLAVALDKLGEHDEAVTVMQQKEARFPGLYETAANLGTFHAHAGRFEPALEHIRAAIEINPDAHFGREIYQQWLIEYMLEQRAKGVRGLPLAGDADSWDSYRGFVLKKKGFDLGGNATSESRAAVAAALRGVMGMMRFGHHDSPVLLEALGDLLLLSEAIDDRRAAKQLAARAYLKASYEVTDAEARDAYRDKARRALSMQLDADEREVSVERVEEEFAGELAEAQAWYANVEADERQWIADPDIDPDARFAQVYFAPPELSPPVGAEADAEHRRPATWHWAVAAGLGLLGLGLLLGMTRRRVTV